MLNRVWGFSPSEILGKIEANGTIFLINPFGVLIGEDASIDVGSFIASTLDIQNKDFEDENWQFYGPSTESVVNQGCVEASVGPISLMGRNIENFGKLETKNGIIALIAANDVIFVEEENGLFGKKGDALVAVHRDGEIYLEHGLSDELATITNDGLLIANLGQNGSNIYIIGDQIDIQGNSLIDVSHANNAGNIQIGGFQGNSYSLFPNLGLKVDAGARMYAFSQDIGDGGIVTLYSQGATSFNGIVNARGGINGGNGGLIHIVGKQYLGFSGFVDAGAYQGYAGSFFTSPDIILPP